MPPAGAAPARAAPTRAATRRGDAGFSLVEAVLAVVLFGMILGATGVLAVRGLRWTGQVDRGIAATTVANQALELARAQAAQLDAAGNTTLLAGRSPSAVNAVDVSDLDLSDTQLAWTPAASGTPAVPLTATKTVGGITYTVRTVIGTCRRPAGGGECRKPRGADGVPLHRIIAAVTWPDCLEGECPVTAATLVDASRDPTYNALADVPLVAKDKCFSTPADTALTFDPVYKSASLQDTGDLGSDPVTVITAPGRGSLAHANGSRPYTYTPQPGISSTETMTYRLTDRKGVTSAPATITLVIGGSC